METKHSMSNEETQPVHLPVCRLMDGYLTTQLLYVAARLAAAPRLRATLLDLEPVVKRARQRWQRPACQIGAISSARFLRRPVGCTRGLPSTQARSGASTLGDAA